MHPKIYAFLVGINDYAPQVGKLSGCLNDVAHYHTFLTSHFDQRELALEILTDSEATRDNIIRQFRSHLGRAKKGDVALFQYSGHGARWKSANAFKQYYPEGKDEGLVCYDSRREDGVYPFDLADKELAVLLAEVAAREPHLAVILDCCHSGSGTRGPDDFVQLKARYTYEIFNERPLESYLDGHYTRMQQRQESLHIPVSKHILLAACERRQKAWETRDHSGVFTDTLLEVLGASGSNLSYADLFVRCRAAVRKRADDQDPQFETYRNFNAWNGFLGQDIARKPPRFSVYFEGNSWKVDAGALHGLPSDPEKEVGLELYPEKDLSQLAGSARTIAVGAQKSELALSFDSPSSIRYRGEITSLPVAPEPVYLAGHSTYTDILEQTLASDQSIGAVFTKDAGGNRYAIIVEDLTYFLIQMETNLLIQGVEINTTNPGDAAQRILAALKHVMIWENRLSLQNYGTKMNPCQVDFVFCELLENGQEYQYPDGEIVMDYIQYGDEEETFKGRFKVRNRTRQTLHIIFAYFSDAYGINVLSNEPVEPGNDFVTLTIETSPEAYFYLDEGDNQAIDQFKLIVSTEKVDDFLLSQDDLLLGKIMTVSMEPKSKGSFRKLGFRKYQNEWFTKNLCIKVVRQLNQVSDRDVSLADGKIVVKAHPSLKANLSLNAANNPTREVGGASDFYKALERNGLELLNFGRTRSENAGVLEVNDIQNAESLQENPLEIELNVSLDENMGILPIVFDGEHILLGGQPHKDEQGNTHISIDHLPALPPDNRRSPGKALKLYFFKTYLKKEENQLSWLEFKSNGSIERHAEAISEKVASAKNILLLVHGILGDTAKLAKGLQLATDAAGKALYQQFDLVLAWDYENLNTPVSETALKMKQQLEAVGLGENDGKKLTLLTHSLGGLVARWLIEQGGGSQMVNHLVMCGTPNNGSPLGNIAATLNVMSGLLTLSLNFFPTLIPTNSALLFLLNSTRSITPTLEQMNIKSEFLTALNSNPDPGVPYTVLAGDIDEFDESSGQNLFKKLMEKIGKGKVYDTLFDRQPHDLAVSVDSIFGVIGTRNQASLQKKVPCHHLNYFESEAGLQALSEVQW